MAAQQLAALEQEVRSSTQRLQKSSLELRLSEVRHASILEAALDAIITIDSEGRILELNPAARLMLRVSHDDAVGRNLGAFALLPGLSEGHRIRVRPNTNTQELFPLGKRIEITALRADGAAFPAEFSLVSLQSEGQTTFTVFLRDITERRQVEQLKNELVSVVSHELRTPLTSIRGSLGLLEAGVLGMLPPPAQELVTIARTNSDRLIRLIHAMLDLEKIEAGRLTLKVERFPVQELLEQALAAVGGLAATQQVQVRCALSPPPPGQAAGEPGVPGPPEDLPQSGGPEEPLAIEGDRDRLVQVLVNLLSNAIKFSPAGEEVLVRASVEDGDVRIEVIDRGPGIPEAQQARLFRRFQRVEAADGSRRPGTGLGLAISRAIVELHGGRIRVLSEPGKGTTVLFTVPGPLRGAGQASSALQESVVR